MIGRSELGRLAARAGIGEQAQEKDYVLAWFLAALSANGPAMAVFKGGTALRRIYFSDYRLSEDLDFTLVDTTPEEFERAIAGWFPWLRNECGIDAAMADVERDTTSLTAKLRFVGPLGASGAAREVKIDATSEESLIFAPVELPILSPYSDLVVARKLRVYDLREIFAEKVRSLLQRTEPRDLYDLMNLVERDAALAKSSLAAFQEKAASKSLDPARLGERLDSAAPTFRTHWERRLAKQLRDIPPFEEAWRKTRRALRQGGFLVGD